MTIYVDFWQNVNIFVQQDSYIEFIDNIECDGSSKISQNSQILFLK